MNMQMIENEALRLPENERARLAHTLLQSLDSSADADWETEWMNEIQRRCREMDDGLVEMVSMEEVSRKARELLH